MYKIKVYINRVQINFQVEFDKALAYFRKHGVDLTFDYEQSDLKNLKSITRELTLGKTRTLLNPVSNLLPQNTYDITMFVFNGAEFSPPNIPTGFCYFPFSPPKPFIDISTHTNNPTDYTFIEICHELMHALVFFANQKGFIVRDVMDTYRDNWNPDSPTGNFAEQWKLLEPYLKSLQVVQLYKPPNFKLEELVPKEIIDKLGEKAWELLDERMLRNLQFFRENLGPIMVNSPTQQYRCFDPCKLRKEGTSQHNHGRAVDCTFKNYTSEQVREWLRKPENAYRLPFPDIWVELGTPHFHFDVRYSDKKGVYFFNP